MNILAKIFLVDDDNDIIFLLKNFLEFNGHKIIDYASDGEEAIQKFKNLNNFPDLVIMDNIMPNKNGIQATKEMLKINPLIPIIFLSADMSIREKAIDLGVKSFIEKPFDIHKLIVKISEVLLQKNEYSQLEL